nr:uncharacterized protein LOC119178534 [Rhipicephalus microplus]
MTNLTMEYIEEKAISSFSPRPRLFLRYIDDCFCVIKTAEVENIGQHLNSVNPAIQLTTECESDHCPPFFDVQVARKRDGLEFFIHRKPMHTGHYLQFDSSHPGGHKAVVVTTLFESARNLCSNDPERKKEEAA